MRRFSPKPKLEIGGVYRDVDGSLVRLVAVQGEVCCWAPVGSASDNARMTHRDNFLRRFVAVHPRTRPSKAKPARRVPPVAVIAPKAA